MKTETYILPEYWASALINNDYSGLEHDDIAQIENFIEDNKQDGCSFYCLGFSEEAYFKWSNDATSLGGNVLKYHFDVSPIRQTAG